jgi:hypothetical protein
VVRGRDSAKISLYRPTSDPFSPHHGDRRRQLVITAPYGMSDTVILAEIMDELDDDELMEVARALGLEPPAAGS